MLIQGRDFAEARAQADRLAAAEGLAYIHGFDAPDIIAGQGTLGLEVLDQVPEVDAIVCPVGGGGLAAGIAIALRFVHEGLKTSWLTEWTANAIVRFDPASGEFRSFPSDRRNASVRQLLGRPGEVWGAESATDRLVRITTR